MKYDFRTSPKAAPDEAESTYTLIPPKDAATTAPPTAAKGDDEVISTPGKKSIHPLL